MGASSSTKGMPSNRRKVIAGLAAVGIGLVGYGVYATTLGVTGTAGTALQAGTDDAIEVTAGCQGDTPLSVTENFDGGSLGESGYASATRTGFTVSGIVAGCKDQKVTLAVKTTGAYGAVGTTQTVGASGGSVTFADTGSGTVTGYSIKIVPAPAG